MKINQGLALIFVALLGACGSNADVAPNQEPTPELGDDFVVRGRMFIDVSTAPAPEQQGLLSIASSATVSQPVTVTLNGSVTFAASNTAFVPPAITNAPLDFGNLSITTLVDNDTKVCGNGHQKCTLAALRVYTTGVTGAGLWNEADQFGAPITATLGSGAALPVGLGAANAAVMQTFAIANNKNVIRLSDFAQAPNYNFDIDFTNAGAGVYSTTIVIEYGMSSP